MHFSKSLSTIFLNALLVTAVIAEHVQGIRSNDVSKTVEKRARGDMGPMPKINYKMMTSFCSKPWKKTSKRSSSNNLLEIRAPPSPYDQVSPKGGISAAPDRPSLYSWGFGSCVGVVILGRPRKRGQEENRHLFHILNESEISVRRQYATIVRAIDRNELEISHIWMYTPDTRRVNPELADPMNQGLDIEARELESFYTAIFNSLQSLSSRIRVQRVYHPFGRTGEITVPVRGQVVFDPIVR